MTYHRILDIIVTSWMPGCNSNEDCEICDAKGGDGTGFNVHFVFPLSLSSHWLSTLVLLPLMGLTNQQVTTGRSLSLNIFFDISLSWTQSEKVYSLKKLLVLGPLLHILYLIYDFGFWDFHIIILNDSWPCTDDSLWEISPTVSYTDT